MINWRLPGTYLEFNERILPTLQECGLAKRKYEPGTLRNKIFGRDRLPENHPGAAYRGAFGPGGSAREDDAVVIGA